MIWGFSPYFWVDTHMVVWNRGVQHHQVTRLREKPSFTRCFDSSTFTIYIQNQNMTMMHVYMCVRIAKCIYIYTKNSYTVHNITLYSIILIPMHAVIPSFSPYISNKGHIANTMLALPHSPRLMCNWARLFLEQNLQSLERNIMSKTQSFQVQIHKIQVWFVSRESYQK